MAILRWKDRRKARMLAQPTIRGEYAAEGRCGATPTGEDAAPAPVLPCSLSAGHKGGHASPSGWAWPNRDGDGP